MVIPLGMSGRWFSWLSRTLLKSTSPVKSHSREEGDREKFSSCDDTIALSCLLLSPRVGQVGVKGVR